MINPIRLEKDGNQYCCIIGENLQVGVAGFGDTKEDAIIEFFLNILAKVNKIKIMGRTIGISLETLTVIFVVLKLTHLITWSWWWVLSPTWIPLCIGIALLTWLIFLSR